MSKEKKMIPCKTCGEQIAANAKVCPHCGAKHKKANPILIGIIVVVALAVIFGTSGGSEGPEKVETPQGGGSSNQTQQTTGQQNSEEKNAFYVGETAALKGVNVTFVDVTESTGSAYNTPTEGNIFVLCEFEIVNNSSNEINISSMMSFNAYCDDYACTFSLSALMEKGNKNQLDGTVAPGKKFNGVIGYEIPEDWKELEVHFTPDFWSNKDITFLAAND